MEFIVFSSKCTVHQPSYHLKFGDTVVNEAPSVKNQGVWFDKTFYMLKQNFICSSCLLLPIVQYWTDTVTHY